MGDQNEYYSVTSDCPNNIFSKCMVNNPKIGLEIEHNTNSINTGFEGQTFMGDIVGLQEINNELASIIPFIVERKFCYYNADSKDGTAQSNFNLFDIDSDNPPLINEQMNTDYQIDDIVKNNIVNTFTNNIYDNVQLLYTNMSNQYNNTISDVNAYELNIEYDTDISALQKDIKHLNSDSLKKEKYYSSKYYDLNRYKANTNILINSIFIVSIIFVVTVLGNNNVISYAFFINSFLAGCLVLYLVLAMSSIRDRQFSNWDKKYFTYVNDLSDRV